MIYQIQKPVNCYDIVDLDIGKMTEQILVSSKRSFDEVAIALMNAPLENTSLLELGVESFDCKYNSSAKKQCFDVNLLGNYLVLNQKAYKYLGNKLSDYGEFISLNTGEEELMLFNLLTFGQEEKSLCEMSYLDGYEDGLKSLVFDLEDVTDKLLFKSKLQGGLTIYCSDTFKNLLFECKLVGVNFNEDLLSCFN